MTEDELRDLLQDAMNHDPIGASYEAATVAGEIEEGLQAVLGAGVADALRQPGALRFVLSAKHLEVSTHEIMSCLAAALVLLSVPMVVELHRSRLSALIRSDRTEMVGAATLYSWALTKVENPVRNDDDPADPLLTFAAVCFLMAARDRAARAEGPVGG